MRYPPVEVILIKVHGLPLKKFLLRSEIENVVHPKDVLTTENQDPNAQKSINRHIGLNDKNLLVTPKPYFLAIILYITVIISNRSMEYSVVSHSKYDRRLGAIPFDDI
ncbi:hypothetical protein POM88_011754 [Heracleum sosnowskyi]|uniref:Uncharacterized protein n=1 Tax=Heracleum sosnowskyi TaxID=360622 RepID=A0AAD8IXD8_9APIA|nr:hypothetical protein POM88_011754 [Heracleum sosnowskyi]